MHLISQRYETLVIPEDDLTENDVTGLLLQKYVEGSSYNVGTKTWTLIKEVFNEILDINKI